MKQPITFDDIGGQRRAFLYGEPQGEEANAICTLWRDIGTGWHVYSEGTYQDLANEQKRHHGQGIGAKIELPQPIR